MYLNGVIEAFKVGRRLFKQGSDSIVFTPIKIRPFSIEYKISGPDSVYFMNNLKRETGNHERAFFWTGLMLSYSIDFLKSLYGRRFDIRKDFRRN